MIQYKDKPAGSATDSAENKAGYYCDICLCKFREHDQIQIGADESGYVMILCDDCWEKTQVPMEDGFSCWRTGCGVKKNVPDGCHDTKAIWRSGLDLGPTCSCEMRSDE